MTVIIDPYMFKIRDINEIEHSIDFFNALLQLSIYKDVKIAVYRGVLEELYSRNMRPFPIYYDCISDVKLRTVIKDLNDMFAKMVVDNYEVIDIDGCDGSEQHSIKSSNVQDNNLIQNDTSYYELMFSLLSSCLGEEISDVIITGIKNSGLTVGTKITQICKCSKRTFDKTYNVIDVCSLETSQMRAVRGLSKMKEDAIFKFIDDPEVIRADHHNKLQKKSTIKKYSDISATNKRVISLLRDFGLNKIIFGEFHEKSDCPKGTIKIKEIKNNEANSIVGGWLYAETGFINSVDLYFPVGVAQCLKDYFEEIIDIKSVNDLKDKIGL